MRHWLGIIFILISFPAWAAPASVYMEELTWPEVQEAVRNGYKTAIIPTGGTEQNGPHMVLGKHNYIVKYTSGEIAKALGNTLVAPVIAYVPEGNITPPEGHMNFAGTISVSEDTFEAILEDTARSLKQHGFKYIFFIGDSGGNQQGQQKIADALSEEWEKEGIVTRHVDTYYIAGQEEWLSQQGFSPADIGSHAGMIDTSELLAIYPEGVRKTKLASHYKDTSGADGNSSKASHIIGQHLLQLKINRSVSTISFIRRPSID